MCGFIKTGFYLVISIYVISTMLFLFCYYDDPIFLKTLSNTTKIYLIALEKLMLNFIIALSKFDFIKQRIIICVDYLQNNIN